jgi:hypothetical protein
MSSSTETFDYFTKITDETMQNLLVSLQQKRDQDASLADVESVIRGFFDKALQVQVGVDSLLPLYLMLEERTGPGPLEDELEDSNLLPYFKKIKALNSIRKILQSYKIKPSVLKQFFASPATYVAQLLTNQIHIFTVEGNIEVGKVPAEQIKISLYKEDVASLTRQSESYPPVFSHMYRLNENLNRYFQPLRFLAKFATAVAVWSLTAVLFIADYTKLIVSKLGKNLIINRLLLNFQTGDLFSNAKQKHVDEKLESALKEALDEIRFTDERYLYLDNQELIQLKSEIAGRTPNYSGERYKEDFIKDVTASQQPAGMIYLKLIAQAIVQKLFQTPLPDSTWGKVKTILAWPVRLLTAVPVFLLAAVVDGVNRLANLALAATTASLVLIAAAALLTVNLPIIAWDTPGFLYNKIKNVFTPTTKQQNAANKINAEETQSLTQSPRGTYHRLLGQDGLLSSAVEEKKIEPEVPAQSSRFEPALPGNLLSGRWGRKEPTRTPEPEEKQYTLITTSLN